MYRFSHFELDDDALVLRKRGRPVRAQPLVLELLVFLVRRRGRVVTKDELLRGPWRGRAAGEGSLQQAVSLARKALGDSPAQPRFIATVRRRGFRFVAEVEVVGASRAERGAGRGGGRSAVMLGRECELDVALSALEDAEAGGGGVLVVQAAPGMGKTELARSVLECARARGFSAHASSALEGAGSPAFGLFAKTLARILETAWRATSAERALELERLRARLEPLVRAPSAPLGLPSPRAQRVTRDELFQAVLDLLQIASVAQPLLLVLEDVHAADTPSLALLSFLAGRLAESRAVLFVTIRTTSAAANWTTPTARNLSLSGLLPTHVQTLLSRALGSPVEPGLARRVADVTAGNPLFVRELARAGARSPGGLADLLDQALMGRLPEGVAERITAVFERVSGRLPDETRAALCSAAVLGREFRVGTLAHMLGVEPRVCMDRLAPAVRHGWVEELGLARFGFTHGLVRETLYHQVEPAERARLHAAARRSLVDGPVGSEVHPVVLAHHSVLAATIEEPDRAIGDARAAARRASDELGHEEAVHQLERALPVADLGPSPRSVLGLRLDLARARLRAGQSRRALGDYWLAAALAREIGDTQALAEAAIGAGEAQTSAGDHDLMALLEEALARLGPERSVLSSLVSSRLAVLLTFTPDSARARALADNASLLAREASDDEALVRALRARRWCAAADEAPIELERLSNEAVSVAASTGDTQLVNTALAWCIADHLARGDRERAESDIQRFQRAAARLEDPLGKAFARRYDVTLALLDGRLGDALRTAQEALDLGIACEDPVARLVFFIQLLLVAFETREFDAVEEFAQRVLLAVPWDLAWRSVLATICAETGRRSAAAALLAEYSAAGFPSSQDMNALIVWCLFSEAAAALGDTSAARELLARIEPHRGRHLVVGAGVASLGPVDYYAARLTLVLGDRAAAQTWFAAGRVQAERAGHRAFAMRCHFGEARASLDGSTRGAERAGDHLRAATQLARDIGSRWLDGRADAEEPELQRLMTPGGRRRRRAAQRPRRG